MARACARECRASCRASASGRSSTGWRARSSSAASCSTTSAASCWRWTGAPPRSRASWRAWRASRRRSPSSSASTATASRRRASATSASSRASRGGDADALVSHDAATCADCLAELRDPGDRRYRYPFINCTNCGPRFTIVRGVPYDRPATTMAGFAMCDGLPGRVRRSGRPPLPRAAERLPGLRAAAPVARRRRRADRPGAGGDAVRAAARWLADGAVLAVKGIGGYHLACDAANESAVAELRARKRREDRPFALMARDETAVEALVELGEAERALLASSARPIVLAPRRSGAQVAAAVAPGVARARRDAALRTAPPRAHGRSRRARRRGARAHERQRVRRADRVPRRRCPAAARGIADGFLVHDRPIETRTDDSLVRAVAVGAGRRPLMLRRSRGYVPASVDLPVAAARPVLACGAQLKATFCLARGAPRLGEPPHRRSRALPGPARLPPGHRALRAAVRAAARGRRLRPAPRLCLDGVRARARRRRADRRPAPPRPPGGVPRRARPRGPAVGAIYDGSGYGTDGTIWGGEVLVGDLVSFERAASCAPCACPAAPGACASPGAWPARGSRPPRRAAAVAGPLAGEIDPGAGT